MNQLFTGIIAAKPKILLKELERTLLLLRDLQPNSHFLTGLKFPEEVKSSSVYGFLTFEKDQKESGLHKLLSTVNLSENSTKAAYNSLKMEI